VELAWQDFRGRTGFGHPVPLTGDTGYFWFFDPDNVETIVKVLDGTGLNGHHWVFYGALSNVEYTLTATDALTGASQRYFNPSGQFASVGDTASGTEPALVGQCPSPTRPATSGSSPTATSKW
jgi:hypothetical protein